MKAVLQRCLHSLLVEVWVATHAAEGDAVGERGGRRRRDLSFDRGPGRGVRVKHLKFQKTSGLRRSLEL